MTSLPGLPPVGPAGDAGRSSAPARTSKESGDAFAAVFAKTSQQTQDRRPATTERPDRGRHVDLSRPVRSQDDRPRSTEHADRGERSERPRAAHRAERPSTPRRTGTADQQDPATPDVQDDARPVDERPAVTAEPPPTAGAVQTAIEVLAATVSPAPTSTPGGATAGTEVTVGMAGAGALGPMGPTGTVGAAAAAGVTVGGPGVNLLPGDPAPPDAAADVTAQPADAGPPAAPAPAPGAAVPAPAPGSTTGAGTGTGPAADVPTLASGQVLVEVTGAQAGAPAPLTGTDPTALPTALLNLTPQEAAATAVPPTLPSDAGAVTTDAPDAPAGQAAQTAQDAPAAAGATGPAARPATQPAPGAQPPPAAVTTAVTSAPGSIAAAVGQARGAVPQEESVRGPEAPAPGQVGGVTATAAAAPVDAPEQSQTQPAAPAVVDQVFETVSRHLMTNRLVREGVQHAVLQLSPEQLGDVTVTMDLQQGSVRLDLAAGIQAIAALSADLGQLRDQLTDVGVNLADVTLTTQNQGAGTGQESRGGDRREGGQPASGPNGPAVPSPRTGTRTSEAIAAAQRRTGSDGLDLLA